MTDAARWLDERDPPAPEAVRVWIDARLAQVDEVQPLHGRLATAALAALEAVVSRPSDRSTASTLLAADALLTYACEAAQEAGLDALDELTQRLDFDRFSELLPRTEDP